MGLLEKAASGVLVARRPQRTHVYASASSLPAALLDGLFEQPLLLLSRWGLGYQKPAFEKFLNDSIRPLWFSLSPRHHAASR